MKLIDADVFEKYLMELHGRYTCEIGDCEKQGNIPGASYLKTLKELLVNIILKFKGQPAVNPWIPCEERMPKEHNSIFAKLKGTDAWRQTMFEKASDEVNVTVEYWDGKRATTTSHTTDSKWIIEKHSAVKLKVVAWMPLPEPYKEER